MSLWVLTLAAWGVFMCGLALGAWWATRDRADAIRAAYRRGWDDRDRRGGQGRMMDELE